MKTIARRVHGALTYEAEVDQSGRVEVAVPFSPGQRVLILVMPEPLEPFNDVLQASESSLDFWDNPLADEDWNAA